MHRYFTVAEVTAQFHVGEEFLHILEHENLIQMKHTLEGDVVISSDDVERVRVAALLTSELDVNFAGVEVIMHMREAMVAMHRQFSEILDALVQEMRHKLPR